MVEDATQFGGFRRLGAPPFLVSLKSFGVLGYLRGNSAFGSAELEGSG